MRYEELKNCIDKLDATNANDAAIKAIRKIVELHKPNKFNGKTCEAHDPCWGCEEWGNFEGCTCNAYPCNTIKAIQEEMG